MTLTERTQPNAPVAALTVSSSANGAETIVTLRGEADVFTLPLVIHALACAIAECEGPIIVDLAHSDFIDTATMRAFARAWQFLDDRGRTLTLRSPSNVAVRILKLLDLSHLIERDGVSAA